MLRLDAGRICNGRETLVIHYLFLLDLYHTMGRRLGCRKLEWSSLDRQVQIQSSVAAQILDVSLDSVIALGYRIGVKGQSLARRTCSVTRSFVFATFSSL